MLYNSAVTGPPYICLDSSHPHQTHWATAPTRATTVLRCDSRTGIATLYENNDAVRRWHDPLEALAWLEGHIREAGLETRWIGYISYDLGRLFEKLPAFANDDLSLPLFAFALLRKDANGTEKRDASSLSSAPETGDRNCLPTESGVAGTLSSTFGRQDYLEAVARTIEYIRAGDVFQVNLSQRFTLPMPDSPSDIYRRLLGAAPARYGGLLDFGDHALICNSPELFLRVTPDAASGERVVTTRPIKGTRPRQAGMDVQLRDSVKDQAELNMIVDVERNDLGRVCQIGSVKVVEPRVIESHPTVYHGAATIRGVLRNDVSFTDLLRATFPGGSVTGAPKIRAMQIIEELEPVRRGPYCGAIGFLAGDGRMEFNVAIRTMIVKDGRVHVPVGGGIVADSDTAAEFDETLVKAKAMFEALGLSATAEQ